MQAGLPLLEWKEEYAGVVSDFQGCIFPRIREKALVTTDPCKSLETGFCACPVRAHGEST